ncbi:NAD(P)-dependent dehydrogenase, short-chain alcohol dehydrogenase family [Nonomuraea solani]|uniref:NAD(P)-dependent dehydrogenase, short-chain alcohol dehydrogenase family n=1 Tax=Nonomuraea solani TaxID=1144553 RepID=A0A1H6F0H5_9ACTN|nr:SDR family oxidoreductase [Nonomuraea solani]SEH02871.1 NAD(P)-dependent dehydrogenase, short-chain alcohol dehydrogenase family [Nonomuraea solani]
MDIRTYVVTGAASGIGAATAEHLAKAGARVIRCDVRDADVLTDLTTPAGRESLVSQVTALTSGKIDAVVAVAGLALPSDLTVRLNFFGTIATLEGLYPLLLGSGRPRAVAVSSLSAIVAADDGVVDACLSMDEERAATAARMAAGRGHGRAIYPSTKLALDRWLRRAAVTPGWAGAGIPLNAVAPGIVDTETARNTFLNDENTRRLVSAIMPQPLAFPGPVDAIAALLAWLAGPENTFTTGQIIYADGGAEATLRP